MRRFRRRDARLPAAAVIVASTVVMFTACMTAPTSSSDPTAPSPIESTEPPATPEATKTPAPVSAAITVAGVDTDGAHLTVAGLVAGVVEEGGSCTFVVTSPTSGAAVNLSSVGIANVSNTVCPAVQSPIELFSKGPWNVVLDYTSDATTISSEPQALEIP